MGERECVFVCLFGSCSAAMQARQGHAYACVLALYKVFVGIYAFPVIVMICNNYLRILFLMPLVISLYDGNRLSHSSLDGESGLFYQYISMIYVGNKLSHSLCDGEQGYLCFFLVFFTNTYQ